MSIQLAQQVYNKALECGYMNCGIIKIAELRDYAQALERRIEMYPDVREVAMTYLAPYAEVEKAYPWAKSLVICAWWYGDVKIPKKFDGFVSKIFLTDYRRDQAAEGFKCSHRFEDALGGLGIKALTEREWGLAALRHAAVKAGLGIIRKNNLLYTAKGSWMHLEGWLIDRDLELKHHPDLKPCPEKCSLCIDACPTKAIQPYHVNILACACFLSARRPCLPAEAHYDKIGRCFYGCDICQDICPANRGAWSEDKDFPGLEELSELFAMEDILRMDDDTLRAVIQPKFWYVAPDEVWRFKNMALNVMCNEYEERYRPYIEEARSDSCDMVRNMADWVARQTYL